MLGSSLVLRLSPSSYWSLLLPRANLCVRLYHGRLRRRNLHLFLVLGNRSSAILIFFLEGIVGWKNDFGGWVERGGEEEEECSFRGFACLREVYFWGDFYGGKTFFVLKFSEGRLRWIWKGFWIVKELRLGERWMERVDRENLCYNGEGIYLDRINKLVIGF